MSGSDETSLNAVEAALQALAPRPAAVDRDALMFRAGRAAARRPITRLMAAAALASLAFVVGRWTAPAPTEVEHIVYVTVPPTPEVPAVVESEAPWTVASPSYQLQQTLIEHGLDGLPPLSPPPPPLVGDREPSGW